MQDSQEQTFAIVFDTVEVVVEASQRLRRTVRGEFGLALLEVGAGAGQSGQRLLPDSW